MATKKPAKKAAKKAVVKKKATPKAVVESGVRLPESAAVEPIKPLAVGEVPEEFDEETGKYVRVIPAEQVEVKPPATFDSLIDAEHSISPELSERIAVERRSHEDERPPSVKLYVPDVLAKAWDSVRGQSDPPLGKCAPSHIDKFYSHGLAIIKGGSPMTGDTVLARFERRVAELMRS